MQAGILYGAIDSLEGMIKRLQQQIQALAGKKATVIATGGFSTFISSHTQVLSATEPTLVLDGIRLIVERLRTKN
jgi:type III pantothenate kinase